MIDAAVLLVLYLASFTSITLLRGEDVKASCIKGHYDQILLLLTGKQYGRNCNETTVTYNIHYIYNALYDK